MCTLTELTHCGPWKWLHPLLAGCLLSLPFCHCLFWELSPWPLSECRPCRAATCLAGHAVSPCPSLPGTGGLRGQRTGKAFCTRGSFSILSLGSGLCPPPSSTHREVPPRIHTPSSSAEGPGLPGHGASLSGGSQLSRFLIRGQSSCARPRAPVPTQSGFHSEKLPQSTRCGPPAPVSPEKF